MFVTEWLTAFRTALMFSPAPTAAMLLTIGSCLGTVAFIMCMVGLLLRFNVWMRRPEDVRAEQKQESQGSGYDSIEAFICSECGEGIVQ